MSPETRKRLFALTQKASATLVASTLAHGRDSHGHPLPDLDILERDALEVLTQAGRIAEAELQRESPTGHSETGPAILTLASHQSGPYRKGIVNVTPSGSEGGGR